MRPHAVRPLAVAAMLAATLPLVVVLSASTPAGAGSRSEGNFTMVSANKAGTDSAPGNGTFGAEQASISADGKVVAFVSKTPAELLVNDPLQLAAGTVTDTNGVEDVFVWDSRVPAPVGPVVTLVSWNKTHTGAAGGNVNPRSDHPVISPQGVGVVFESRAKDLTTEAVTADENLYAWVPAVSDVFPVFLINKTYNTGDGSNSVNNDPSISVNPATLSAKVAFTSSATDLVDPNAHQAKGTSQVYVRNLVTQSTSMVSVATDGDGTVSGASAPMISADGLDVVFASGGADLVAGVDETGGDIFERNLLTDTTKLISKANASSQGTTGNDNPVVSADGSAVAWEGNDPALSPTPHNGNAHIFYRLSAAPPVMVDTAYLGLLGCDNNSNNAGLSLDGTSVVFESNCTNMTPPSITETSGTDVYVRRMLTDPQPKLVSVDDAGDAPGNGSSFICPGVDPPCRF